MGNSLPEFVLLIAFTIMVIIFNALYTQTTKGYEARTGIESEESITGLVKITAIGIFIVAIIYFIYLIININWNSLMNY